MTGSLIKRSEHSWSIVVYLGRDAITGKKKQKWHTFQGNKKAAEAELVRLLNDLNTGAYVEPKKTTVAEFLERWLKDYAEVNVAGKTLERYQGIVRLHLIPAFGNLPVQQLSPMQIQQHYSNCLRDGARKDGRKGPLSKRTVMHHHRVLSEALKMALRWQLIVRNPADAVTPPSPDDKEMEILEEGRSVELFDAAKGTRLYIPVLLASCGGLRRGEVLATEWDSIDWKTGSIHIRQSLEETKTGVRFKIPKTKRGRRAVALPAFVLRALEEHKAKQDEVRAALGKDYQEHGLMCCADDGSVWKPSAFTSAYRALLSRRGLSAVGFHNLRHSHASGLLRNGVDLKVISSRLGHSRVAFTADTYIHLVPGQDQEAANRTGAAFEKALLAPRNKRSA